MKIHGNTGRAREFGVDRLGTPGSPLDRAQVWCEAQYGPVREWTRRQHHECSAIARQLAGLSHTIRSRDESKVRYPRAA